eukprot:1749970-Alexandrium_andersonii.AAC.1
MRSELEVRGPRNGLKIGPESRGVFSGAYRADSESADEMDDRGGPRSRKGSALQSAIRRSETNKNKRNPWLLAREK